MFKVWQKVRILPRMNMQRNDSTWYIDEMQKYSWIVTTIKRIDYEDVYSLQGTDWYRRHWDRLEAVEETDPTEEIKKGDMVWVSNASEEWAKKEKTVRQFICKLPLNARKPYVTTFLDSRITNEQYDIFARKYIVPIPKEQPKKKRRVTCTDEQWEEIQKIVKSK